MDIPLIVTSTNEPEDVIAPSEDIPQNVTGNIILGMNGTIDTPVLEKEVEKTVVEDKTEEIPSFSEWAQKRLEEVEKSQQTNSTKIVVSNGKFISAFQCVLGRSYFNQSSIYIKCS